MMDARVFGSEAEHHHHHHHHTGYTPTVFGCHSILFYFCKRMDGQMGRSTGLGKHRCGFEQRAGICLFVLSLLSRTVFSLSLSPSLIKLTTLMSCVMTLYRIGVFLFFFLSKILLHSLSGDSGMAFSIIPSHSDACINGQRVRLRSRFLGSRF